MFSRVMRAAIAVLEPMENVSAGVSISVLRSSAAALLF